MMFVAEGSLEFGCTFGDIPCAFAETTANSMATFADWLAESTIGGQSFNTRSGLWDASIAEVGNWLPFAILAMLITMVVGIIQSTLTLDRRRIMWVAITSVMAIPSTILALTLGGELLNIADTISDGILDRLGGNDGFINIGKFIATAGTGDEDIGGAVVGIGTLLGSPAMLAPSFLLLGGLILGLLMMSVMLAFRDFAVMILIAFAPLAFSMLTNKGGFEIVRKWAWALVAMVIAKPLMFGVLALVLRAMGETASLFSGQGIVVIVGFAVTALMPLMAYQFFNFLGTGAAADAGETIGSQAGQKASNAGRNVTQGAQSVFRRGSSGGGGGGRGASGGSDGTAPSSPTGGGEKPRGSKGTGSQERSSTSKSGEGSSGKSADSPRTDGGTPPGGKSDGSSPKSTPPSNSSGEQPARPPAKGPSAPESPRPRESGPKPPSAPKW